MQKFAVGQAIRRVEDERFLKGEGRYIDDIAPEGLAHAAFVRSPHAHARIVSIDTEDARDLPGVLAVLTHEDVAKAGLGAFPTLDTFDGLDKDGVRVPPRHALTGGVVRFVGDPVATVIAETPAIAREAAELVTVEYEDLPAVVDLRHVLERKAPLVWPQFKTNRCYHFVKGDPKAVEAALKASHHVTRLTLVNNRLSPSAIEPRGVIGDWNEASQQYVLTVSGQAVHGQRGQMADRIFKVKSDNVRVIMPDVGGGFGAKNFVYPENVMVMLAAKLLRRPVKWIATRSENFLAEIHARDHVTEVALGLDRDGRFTALNVETVANMGAYLSSYATIIPSSASYVALGGPYAIPHMAMTVDAVFTNTNPIDAYRGAGRPEAAYLLERIVDVAAAETGRDPADLRRINFIRSFPHKNALGMLIDVGDFEGNLDAVQSAADTEGFDARVEASRAAGKWRGRGFSSYMEVTLGVPFEEAEVRFEENGTVSLLVGSQSTGQGHETAYLQILETELGVPHEKVRFVQGDTGVIPTGGGHGGSRSLKIAGSSVYETAGETRAKAKRAAAFLLGVPEEAISFEHGLFVQKGSNRRLSALEIEEQLRKASPLPEGVPSTLTTRKRFERSGLSFPNGVHLCEVEVDPETGVVRLDRYTIVDDFGAIVNPLIAAGQVMGGTAQGIGQALLELAVHDETGQLLTGSFMDYAMPRADVIPPFSVRFNESAPTKTNPLGVKGAGEAGATGAPAAVVNATVDALRRAGLPVLHVDMPLTPERVWQAIRTAR
ncbi:MAG: xanthine dehydrogenase family protein molybdopterin-binding subunit [Hyphomicrobiales bacterium]